MNTSRYGRPLIQTGETKAAEAARLQIYLSSKKAVATQRLKTNHELLKNLQNPQLQQQIMSEQQNPNEPQNNLQILKTHGCNQETINNAKLFFGVTPGDDFVAYYHTSLQNLRTEGDVNNPTNPNNPNSPTELLYTGINDPDLLAENNMQSPERIGMDPVNPTRGGRKIRKYRTRRYKRSKKIKNKRTSRRSKFFQN